MWHKHSLPAIITHMTLRRMQCSKHSKSICKYTYTNDTLDLATIHTRGRYKSPTLALIQNHTPWEALPQATLIDDMFISIPVQHFDCVNYEYVEACWCIVMYSVCCSKLQAFHSQMRNRLHRYTSVYTQDFSVNSYTHGFAGEVATNVKKTLATILTDGD